MDEQSKHKIVFLAKTVREKRKDQKQIPCKVKDVTFKGLIQDMCSDFNIEYNQMCINQEDKKRK